jgi:hypothetical protein
MSGPFCNGGRFFRPNGTTDALFQGMMLILEGIIAVYVFGMLVMLAGIQRAPEGYEDEEGFHICWKNNDPDIRDVACVWALSSNPQ